ncbi:multifunctional CCA addition/repair protein [Candidatus Rariloculus sp.]|uniref:multifunctional CCA addition/repair protein n=1 Tax=Candidatus Rariloculus sp. TaxID=3101265 RepID=UPI003D0E9E05
MNVYLVGGAVRDELLGIEVVEHDWVVVGATADVLRKRGYRQVGRDFPVFLHPETNEEYALARTERKVSPGHTGFAVDASPDVTLEQDLARRDLTINAMAKDQGGRIIDPWGGRRDIANRQLRSVSDAFREDPLRVLRTARFAARFNELGFAVAAETMRTMAEIVGAGELEALPPERVWQETHKALAASRPEVYFEVLRECGALERVFPEIENLFGVPQPKRWHPEIDSGVHTLMALGVSASLSDSTEVRFAVLMHDLGKATTPKAMLPSHHGHGERSVQLIRDLAARLRVPRKFQALAELVARHHGLVHRATELKPRTIVELLTQLDAFRQPDRFEKFLLACEADARGRAGLQTRPYPYADLLRLAQHAAREVGADDVRAAGLDGAELGDAIRIRRIDAVRQALRGAEAPARRES